MGKFLDAFDFEKGSGGVSVVSTKHLLHSGCTSEDQVDRNIQLLKDELDDVAKRMKVAMQDRKSRPIFGEPDNA